MKLMAFKAQINVKAALGALGKQVEYLVLSAPGILFFSLSYMWRGLSTYFTNLGFIRNVMWELAMTVSFPSERVCHIHFVQLPQDSSNVVLIFTGLNNLESHLTVASLSLWIWEIFAIAHGWRHSMNQKPFGRTLGLLRFLFGAPLRCMHAHTCAHSLWYTSQLVHWFQIKHAPPPAQLHGPWSNIILLLISRMP